MLSLAAHVLDTKAGHFDPAQFKDEFEMELRKLVRRKASGKPIYAEPAERPAKVVNLMDALRRSVEGPKPPAAARSAHRKTKARKTTTTKRKRSRAA
jgi:DNA end-binding protein Ku